MSPRAQTFLENNAGTIITVGVVLGGICFNYGTAIQSQKDQSRQMAEVKTDVAETKQSVIETRLDIARIKGKLEYMSPSPRPQTSIAKNQEL